MANKYIYTEAICKNKIRYSKVREDYYKALYKSLIVQGATNTITEFDKFLNGKVEKIHRESLSILSEYRLKDIIKMLQHDFDDKKTLSTLIKKSVDNFLSQKLNILRQALGNTYKRYNINQAKLALRTYYKEKNAELFTRSTKKEPGRGTVTKEIELPTIKLLVGAKLPVEYGYLLEESSSFSITKHITCLDKLTEKLLDEYINKKGL